MTPLGWHFWLDMPRSLGRIRQLGIDEWAPPSLTQLAELPFWISIAALVALAALRGRALLADRAARRDGQVTVCACALALVPLALTAVRNVPPFLMLAVPAIAALMPGVFDSKVDFARAPEAECGHCRCSRRDCIGHHLGCLHEPPGAIQLVAAAGGVRGALDRCQGNVYNRYDEGGYLIWFAPGRKVFLDGRQDPYPPSLIKEQMRVEASGDFERLFARYDVRCAFLPSASRVSASLARAGWTTLFRDSLWTVFAEQG